MDEPVSVRGPLSHLCKPLIQRRLHILLAGHLHLQWLDHEGANFQVLGPQACWAVAMFHTLSPDGSQPAASSEKVVGAPQDRRSLERRTANSAKRSAVPYIIVTPPQLTYFCARNMRRNNDSMNLTWSNVTARMYAKKC